MLEYSQTTLTYISLTEVKVINTLITLFEPIIGSIPYTSHKFINVFLFSASIYVILNFTKSTFRLVKDSLPSESLVFLSLVGLSLFALFTLLSVMFIKLIGYLMLREKILLAGIITFILVLFMVLLNNISSD